MSHSRDALRAEPAGTAQVSKSSCKWDKKHQKKRTEQARLRSAEPRANVRVLCVMRQSKCSVRALGRPLRKRPERASQRASGDTWGSRYGRLWGGLGVGDSRASAAKTNARRAIGRCVTQARRHSRVPRRQRGPFMRVNGDFSELATPRLPRAGCPGTCQTLTNGAATSRRHAGHPGRA